MIRDLPASESAVILHNLETMLSEKYHIGHATVQFECHAHQEQYCSTDGLYCHMEAGDHDDHRGHDHPHVETIPVEQKGQR